MGVAYDGDKFILTGEVVSVGFYLPSPMAAVSGGPVGNPKNIGPVPQKKTNNLVEPFIGYGHLMAMVDQYILALMIEAYRIQLGIPGFSRIHEGQHLGIMVPGNFIEPIIFMKSIKKIVDRRPGLHNLGQMKFLQLLYIAI